MPALAPYAASAHRDGDAPAGSAAPQDRARLDLLRDHAARARHRPRIDIFRACELIAAEDGRVVDAHADMLLRTLPEALGRRPTFHRPGTAEVSFDEAWLMRLIERMEAGDADSAVFLAARRVPPHHRRSLLFLAAGLKGAPATPRAA